MMLLYVISSIKIKPPKCALKGHETSLMVCGVPNVLKYIYKL